MSLYNRVGGVEAINAVAHKFYQLMSQDQTLKGFFKGKQFTHMQENMTVFMSMATGGPNNYTGKDMKKAHQHLNIKQNNFDDTWKHFKTALEFHKVTPQIIEEFKKLFYAANDDIVVK